MEYSEKVRENRIRRAAHREGMIIRKSRGMYSCDNLGGYMVINAYTNSIVAGPRFDMFLDDLEEFFDIKPH